ncbi:MAG: deoxyribonuclease IV [Butyrivibrio sp.]|uniref:deoxyribonuclease IV n=1 Tax=Butyrivibrio sp. TaxID=28121 RepID=UPI001B12EF88|nr:deoxyribonuclease IV [Butyrivibrio sp.]MBO6240610.1 deoxyribonuclease IV [Butyrivibrio sp.]
MIYIGCHLTVTNGYEAMGHQMLDFGGNTFAWFTRNPRGGKSKEIDPEDVKSLSKVLLDNKFGKLVAHGSYTMNLCSSNPETRANGLDMLQKDLEKMESLPGQYYNFHPGSHTGQGADVGIEQIVEGLNKALFPQMKTTVLLETMAGKGSEVGRNFEELKAIIEGVELNDKLGVCFDTCHIWDAGYDIVDNLDGVLEQFDKIVGLDKLKAVHFNDSKNACGAAKDRHEKLGQGFIGMDAMKRIATHPVFDGLPFILETPNDDKGYIQEIATVKSWFI